MTSLSLWASLNVATNYWKLLREETARRDALVRQLSAAGLPRRTVADAAGLTAGRVQQIVGTDDESKDSAESQRERAIDCANAVGLSRSGLKEPMPASEGSSSEAPMAQRLRALERANQIRLARAELKGRIANGEVSAAEVILLLPARGKQLDGG